MLQRSPIAWLLPVALCACGGAGADGDRAPAEEGAGPPVIAVEAPVSPPGEPRVTAGCALTPRLPVSDLAASLVFYREVLGFELVAAGGAPGEPEGWALLARGPARLELRQRQASAAPAGDEPALALATADAAALFDQVGDRAPLVRALNDTPGGSREFAVADPDGHLLVFSEGL